MTRQRAAILTVIRTDKSHPTAEEIFERAKEILPTISRATVYNNLKALEEEGIVRRIGGEGAASRYDSSFVPHGHLFCERCGSIYDFSIENFEGILSDVTGVGIDSYELRANGTCKRCRDEAKRNRN